MPRLSHIVRALSRLSARRLAGLSVLFNAPLLLVRAHENAFDTYVHIFLADHYRERWWDLWEPRWYQGFSVASYPPLVHQLIALISLPISAALRFFVTEPRPYLRVDVWSGEELAYLVVLMSTLALMPVAVRAFARIFVGPRAAGMAALCGVFLPALSLSAWTFGQLPNVAATGIVLVALARGHAYVLRGRGRHLLQAVALAALAGAAHHGVFLLVPFAGAAVGVQAFLRAQALPHVSRLARFGRLILWSALSAVTVAIVLWPFIAWSRAQTLQTAIDHVSRHDLLRDGFAALFLFWPAYGPLLLAIPWTVWAIGRGLHRRVWPLFALASVLLVLGLGGTTALPRLIYGTAWAWLTYDRFGFWAALCWLPLAAAGLVWAGRAPGPVGRALPLVFLASMGLWAWWSGWLGLRLQTQPPPVDLGALANFLDEPQHRPYRYFTFGLGDQAAKLATITENGTPDGSYHTARELPELRASGLGALDGAMWLPGGATAIRPFLDRAGSYGARYAFVNHSAYLPVLRAAGWHYVGTLAGVGVWDQPEVTPRSLTPPSWAGPNLAAIWWGSAPLAALALSASALALDRRRNRRLVTRERLAWAVSRVRQYAWVMTVLTLTVWWVHVISAGSLPYVYFVYQSRVLFASDVMALVTLALWLLERRLTSTAHQRLGLGPRSLALSGLVVVAAAGLSTLISSAPLLSLALFAHLLLLGAWYIMLINAPPSPRLANAAFAVALGVQALTAVVQAARQSTEWLNALHLTWPGPLTAAVSGASVVELQGGARWLRAYGTLPHPNILAAMLLIGLGAGVERFLSTRRPAWMALTLLIVAGLLLTFSRTAWVAVAVILLGSVWIFRRYAPAHWPRLGLALGASAVLALLIGLRLLPLFMARANVGSPVGRLEQRSLNDRAILTRTALSLISKHPLTGVGAGTFVLEVARIGGPDLPFEPVHNLPLLLTAETGPLGLLGLLGLGGATVWRLWQRRMYAEYAPAEVMMGLVVLGMLVVGLFDHFWWTLAPTRLALATAYGLWVGWAQRPRRGETRTGSDSVQRGR